MAEEAATTAPFVAAETRKTGPLLFIFFASLSRAAS